MSEVMTAKARSLEYSCRYASSVEIEAKADEIFSYLDDPRKLSSHMEKSSWMMAGSSMKIELDAKEGKELGAEIILRGSMMGIPVFVREVISERNPPLKKVWETVGEQKMIIIEQYRMGFEIETRGASSTLKVFIDYSLPKSPAQRILGVLFGKIYARWCTERMAKDAAHHFKGSQS